MPREFGSSINKGQQQQQQQLKKKKGFITRLWAAFPVHQLGDHVTSNTILEKKKKRVAAAIFMDTNLKTWSRFPMGK